MQTLVYAGYEEIEDDLQAVRKRETSRLGYRDRVAPQRSGTVSQAHRSLLSGSTVDRISTGASPFSAASSHREDRVPPGLPRASIADALAPIAPIAPAARRLGASMPVEAADGVVVVDGPAGYPTTGMPAAASTEQVEWRTVRAGAPVLLLSASLVLEVGKPGPILGPGMRYRVTSVAGSVVGLEVLHANGDTRSGYANAVDLRCIGPKIATGELAGERGLMGRLRLTKLATTTFGLFGG